jgi:hypothetical protein
MGLNFDDYLVFQPKITPAQRYATQSVCVQKFNAELPGSVKLASLHCLTQDVQPANLRRTEGDPT